MHVSLCLRGGSLSHREAIALIHYDGQNTEPATLAPRLWKIFPSAQFIRNHADWRAVATSFQVILPQLPLRFLFEGFDIPLAQ